MAGFRMARRAVFGGVLALPLAARAQRYPAQTERV